MMYIRLTLRQIRSLLLVYAMTLRLYVHSLMDLTNPL